MFRVRFPRLFALAAWAGLLASCGQPLPQPGLPKEVGPFRVLFDVEAAAAADLIKDKPEITIIDLRPPEQYLAGHIPGAINHEFIFVFTEPGAPPPPKGQGSRFRQEDVMDHLDKEKPYLLYGAMWEEDRKRLLEPPAPVAPGETPAKVEKYTRVSNESDFAAYLMMGDDRRFLEVHQIIGGFDAWVDAGLPVESGDGAAPAKDPPAPVSPAASTADTTATPVTPPAEPEAPATFQPKAGDQPEPSTSLPSTSFDLPSFTLPGVRRADPPPPPAPASE